MSAPTPPADGLRDLARARGLELGAAVERLLAGHIETVAGRYRGPLAY